MVNSYKVLRMAAVTQEADTQYNSATVVIVVHSAAISEGRSGSEERERGQEKPPKGRVQHQEGLGYSRSGGLRGKGSPSQLIDPYAAHVAQTQGMFIKYHMNSTNPLYLKIRLNI